jgi:hypothetical protein
LDALAPDSSVASNGFGPSRALAVLGQWLHDLPATLSDHGRPLAYSRIASRSHCYDAYRNDPGNRCRCCRRGVGCRVDGCAPVVRTCRATNSDRQPNRAGANPFAAETLDLVRSLGASKAQQFRFLLAPAALPAALSGLRISLTYAVAAAAISESIGATSGLGLYIARSQRGFRYDQVFVGVLVVTMLSIALFSIVYLLDRLLCPWRHTADETSSGPTPI